MITRLKKLFIDKIDKLEDEKKRAKTKEEKLILMGKITGHYEAFNIVEKELRK